MTKILEWCAAIIATVVIAGCGGGSAPPAPANVAVTPHDSSAEVTWTMEAGIEYWVWVAQGTTLTPASCSSTPGCAIHRGASSPYLVLALTNGIQYSLIVNGSNGGSAVGPSSPLITFVPGPVGSTWTVGTPLASTLRGVGYTGAAAIATAYLVATGTQGTLYSSGDAKTWTALNSNVGMDLYAVVYADAKFVVVGDGGVVVTSSDAINWTALTLGGGNLYGLAVNGALIVAVGGEGEILVSTDGGAVWTTENSGTTNDLRGVVFANNLYVAVGNGTVLTSSDATTWLARALPTTANLRSVAYGAGTFVAVGDGGAVLTSTDGVTWTARGPLAADSINAVVYGTSFIAVGSGGAIFTSADGVNWTAAASGTTKDLNAVAFSPGVANSQLGVGYVAVGVDGANLIAF